MEFILLGVLAKLGLGLVVVATLTLLAMHAVENQKPASTARRSSRMLADAGDFRLHQYPRVKRTEGDDTIEEPTQRAA